MQHAKNHFCSLFKDQPGKVTLHINVCAMSHQCDYSPLDILNYNSSMCVSQ